MGDLEQSHTQLESNFNMRDFALDTVLQINKDLQGLSPEFLDISLVDRQDRLSAIAFELAKLILVLNKHTGESLAQFIYRVDLTERKFVQSIERDNAMQELALLVIEREAQKVYLRKKFSN